MNIVYYIYMTYGIERQHYFKCYCTLGIFGDLRHFTCNRENRKEKSASDIQILIRKKFILFSHHELLISFVS